MRLRTTLSRVEEERLTTADLLLQWREATRAAELADRLAELALSAAEQSDSNALASEQIARMAEKAAVAAERAAQSARKAATKASALALENRAQRLRDADEAVVTARASEAEARQRYELSRGEPEDRHGAQDVPSSG
jgi:hypothetical protein